MRQDSQPTIKTPVYFRVFFDQLHFAVCPLCKDKSSPATVLCNKCLISLPVLGWCCEKCKEPLAEGSALFCRQCQKYERPYNDCIIPFTYEPPVSDMLKRLKYGGGLVYLRPLVNRLADSLENHYQDKAWPQAIIPVPLHWWRLRKRGFNQSNLIARSLSKTTGIPVLNHCIKKKRVTPQRGLALSERKRNIKGVFSVRKPPETKHVAIVDDVMTTGSTIEELCRTLKKAGVLTLDIWCLVRTPAHYTV